MYCTLQTLKIICHNCAKMQVNMFSSCFMTRGKPVQSNTLSNKITRLEKGVADLKSYSVNERCPDQLWVGVDFDRICYLYRMIFLRCVGDISKMTDGDKYDIFKDILKSTLSHPAAEEQQETAEQRAIIGSVQNTTEDIYKTDKDMNEFLKETDLSGVGKKSAELFENEKAGGRYKSFFEAGKENAIIEDMTVFAEINGKKEKGTLYDLLFPRGNGFPAGMVITSRGGAGKSFAVQNVIRRILKDRVDVGSFCIPLNELHDSGKNAVSLYLTEKCGFRGTDSLNKILEVRRENIILFLDGLNEVAYDVRNSVVGEIAEIHRKYGTRYVFTSRSDYNNLFVRYFGDMRPSKAKMSDLSDDQITEYFLKNGCNADLSGLPPKTRRLLASPMGLSMYVELRRENAGAPEFDSLGKLLNAYLERILGPEAENLEGAKSMLKRVAFEMVRLGTFDITFEQINNICLGNGCGLTDNQTIQSVFAKNENDCFCFTHQNFRDCLAAEKLASLAKGFAINPAEIPVDLFSRNPVNTDGEILELTSAFLSEEETENIIGRIREIGDETDCAFVLSVMIFVWAYVHNDDISGLDLSYLDLRKVSLNNYCLSSADSSVDLTGSAISADTFIKPALSGGSSAVTAYRRGDRQYVTAFGVNSALTYDAEENCFSSARWSDKGFGWVNCCVHDAETGKIYLGCRNGNTAVFDPGIATLTTDNIDGEEKNEGPSYDGIQCILIAEWNGERFLITSDSAGTVLVRAVADGYRIVNKFEFSAENAETCCMSSDKDNNVFIACGDKVFLMNEAVREPDVFAEIGQNIEDICVSAKYVFLNFGGSIEVISKNQPDEVVGEFSAAECAETGRGDCCFTFLSPIPGSLYTGEEGILAGIKAKNESLYRKLPDFIEIRLRRNNADAVVAPVRCGHKLATYAGAYFKAPNSAGKEAVRLMTVGDDRKCCVSAPYDERVTPVAASGAYSAVHCVSVIDEKNIVSAQYDGTLIHLRKSEHNGQWQVAHIRKVHTGWVWKVCPLPGESGETLPVVSCSYDGTLRLTELGTDNPSAVLCRCDDRMLDFFIEGPDLIWALSASGIYRVSRSDNGEWSASDYYLTENERRKVLRCIAPRGTGKEPCFFSNEGNGTPGAVEFFVGSVQRKYLLFSCEEGVYVRKMIYDEAGPRLILAGNRNTDGDTVPYVAAYDLTAEGTANGNFASRDITEYKGDSINDCLMVSENEFLALTKNREVLAIFLTEEGFRCSPAADVKTAGQPMTAGVADGLICIGLLNGEIVLLEDSRTFKTLARTHADLLTTAEVDLRDCDIDNEAEFSAMFVSYFKLKSRQNERYLQKDAGVSR